MRTKEKGTSWLSKIEIIVAAILFFAMLVSCGLYINIKMNGKISSLPSLPEKDKRQLLKAVASESVVYKDDLIEPVFVGFKNGVNMICATPDDTVRKSIENTVYDSVFTLFSGEHKKKVFNNASDVNRYVTNLKNSDTYMLISFFCDIPSNVFLSCVSPDYTSVKSNGETFYLKHLFLVPDTENNMYGIGVSEDNEVNILYPEHSISYDKIASKTYDVSGGYSYFEYENRDGVYPLLSSSISVNSYNVESSATVYGKEMSQPWVSNVFDVFGVNSSLVKNFLSGDKTEINYVDETSEIIINDNGNVSFTVTEGAGIYLEDFLGYFPENGNDYTGNDKIFAVKNIVNKLKSKNDITSYSVSEIDYDIERNVLKVYLKLFVDGIMVTDNEYDACFEIVSNYLKSAKFTSLVLKRNDDESLLMPLKYASVLGENKSVDVYCPKLCSTDEENTKIVKWAGFSSSPEEVAK